MFCVIHCRVLSFKRGSLEASHRGLGNAPAQKPECANRQQRSAAPSRHVTRWRHGVTWHCVRVALTRRSSKHGGHSSSPEFTRIRISHTIFFLSHTHEQTYSKRTHVDFLHVNALTHAHASVTGDAPTRMRRCLKACSCTKWKRVLTVQVYYFVYHLCV